MRTSVFKISGHVRTFNTFNEIHYFVMGDKRFSAREIVCVMCSLSEWLHHILLQHLSIKDGCRHFSELTKNEIVLSAVSKVLSLNTEHVYIYILP